MIVLTRPVARPLAENPIFNRRAVGMPGARPPRDKVSSAVLVALLG